MAAITILGGGGWGTALSGLLAEKGHTVTLWVRYSFTADLLRRERTNERHLPGVLLPSNLQITSSFAEMSSADYLLWATPSTALGEIARSLLESKYLTKNSVMVSCVKGLDHQRYRRMTEILEDVFRKFPRRSSPDRIMPKKWHVQFRARPLLRAESRKLPNTCNQYSLPKPFASTRAQTLSELRLEGR